MKLIHESRASSAIETIRVRFCGAVFVFSLLLFSHPLLRADVVTDWNEIMLNTAAASPDPVLRGHTAAITQVAVFEAVNSIIGDYEPYLNMIPAPQGASAEAAAITAAHRVLTVLHPENSVYLEAARVNSLAMIPESVSKTNGIAVGIAAANAILALRADDGFNDVVPYTPGTGPGEWQPTPPDLSPAFRPGLGQVATFGIRNGRQFRADPPPPLQSAEYARDYSDVKEKGETNSSARPVDRANVARFFAMIDADGIYYPAARQITAAQGKSLAQNARIFALLSMAVWDGAVACFESKYHFNLWRPVTAIRAGDTDSNASTVRDLNWRPFVFTPPFPSYPSGHASFGAAARAVLEHVFGPEGHSIVLTNPAAPDIVLRYTTFKQITDDIDDARVYGGVHYRFDQDAGARQGRRVGEYLLHHKLRPLRGPDCEKR